MSSLQWSSIKTKVYMDTKGLKYTKIIIQNSSCVPVLVQKSNKLS